MAAGPWILYVLRCRDDSLYCGITNDLKRRLTQHQSGAAARYTRGRGPVTLAAHWPQPDRASALRAELAFKRLSRSAKERQLAADNPSERIIQS